MADDFAHLDATAQAELVRDKQASPLELVDAAIARIETHNEKLGAVIWPLFERARARAQSDVGGGPFAGVPMVLKDLGPWLAGAPYAAGMKFLADAPFTPPKSDYLTDKFEASGLIICAKTNTPELGILPTTEPDGFPPSRNPYDIGRSTGGSSGGSAAAVAAGLVPIGHANDGGGSIRIPASCCGLVGLKPSRGRVSNGPHNVEMAAGLAINGAVTRSVRDTATVLDAIRGLMPGDPYVAPALPRPLAQEVGAEVGKLRIGFATRFLSPTGTVQHAHDDCVAAVADLAGKLEALGHHVEEREIKALHRPEYATLFMAVWAVGVASGLRGFELLLKRPVAEGDVEPLTWALAEMGRAVPAERFAGAIAWLRLNARTVAAYYDDFDLFLTPTLAEPPAPLGTFDEPEGNAIAAIFRAGSYAAFTPAFNATGQPAISLPTYRNAAGLPIGTQLVAPYGREDVLVRVAAQIEAAHPFEHSATVA